MSRHHPRRYRIRFSHGSYYAEHRGRFFWRKLAESSTWVDDSYACKTRERALELIASDKARIAAWSAIPKLEDVR